MRFFLFYHFRALLFSFFPSIPSALSKRYWRYQNKTLIWPSAARHRVVHYASARGAETVSWKRMRYSGYTGVLISKKRLRSLEPGTFGLWPSCLGRRSFDTTACAALLWRKQGCLRGCCLFREESLILRTGVPRCSAAVHARSARATAKIPMSTTHGRRRVAPLPRGHAVHVLHEALAICLFFLQHSSALQMRLPATSSAFKSTCSAPYHRLGARASCMSR